MATGQYAQMLRHLSDQQAQQVNNGTNLGGIGYALSEGVKGWLMGRDMRQQGEVSSALSEAFGGQPQPEAPGVFGRIKGALGIGEQPQPMAPLSQRVGASPDYGTLGAKMAQLGAKGNPYAAEYAMKFGAQQMSEDAARKAQADELALRQADQAREDARWQQQFGLQQQQLGMQQQQAEWERQNAMQQQLAAQQAPIQQAGGAYADSKNIEGMHYDVLTRNGQKVYDGTATPQEIADYTIAYREMSKPKYSRVDDGQGGFNLVPVDQGSDLSGFPVPPQMFGSRQQDIATPAQQGPSGGKLTPVGLVGHVISAESAGNPNAVSPVGATGLMQLMPATAKEVAGELGLPFSNELMRDPQYNQMLGEAYLEKMHRKFNGSTALALAAYNAGPGRVQQWTKQFGDPTKGQISEVDFVSRIPFSETKNYVTKILGNFLGAQRAPAAPGGAMTAPPAPAGAMSPLAPPPGAMSAPPPPPGAMSAPPAPPGWNAPPPMPQGAGSAPPAPPGWNNPPPAPAGAMSPPPAPRGAQLTTPRQSPGVISVPNPRAEEAKAIQQRQTDTDLGVFDGAIKGARDILKNPGSLTTGFLGGLAKNIGGTDAKALNDYYDVLRSKIGMMALKDLKEASATGASGLGAMSEKELDMLQSQLGKLDITSDVAQQKATLDAIDRYLAAKRGQGAPQAQQAAAPAGDLQSEFDRRASKY